MTEAELESPLVEVDGTDEAHDACSQCDASASRSLVHGIRLASKPSISEVTKCSPSTISKGSERGIFERL